MMSNDDNEQSPGFFSRLSSILFAILINAIFAVLGIVGVLVINAIFQAWRIGDIGSGEAILSGLFGLLMMVIGFGFFIVAYIGAPRFLGGLERRRTKYADRPWLANRQWRARRVVRSTGFTVWFIWIWCVIWWAIIGFFWSVNGPLILADLRGPWSVAIPSAMPFVAGIIGLLVAISLTWQRVLFGDAVLLIDTLPGYLGENFSGKVRARLKRALSRPIEISLTCGSLRRTRVRNNNGGTKTTWVTDEIWTNSLDLHPTQTTFDKGIATLPISFDLPQGLPESGDIMDEPQIVWTLTVKPGYRAGRSSEVSFQIPVYKRRDAH